MQAHPGGAQDEWAAAAGPGLAAQQAGEDGGGEGEAGGEEAGQPGRRTRPHLSCQTVSRPALLGLSIPARLPGLLCRVRQQGDAGTRHATLAQHTQYWCFPHKLEMYDRIVFVEESLSVRRNDTSFLRKLVFWLGCAIYNAPH